MTDNWESSNLLPMGYQNLTPYPFHQTSEDSPDVNYSNQNDNLDADFYPSFFNKGLTYYPHSNFSLAQSNKHDHQGEEKSHIYCVKKIIENEIWLEYDEQLDVFPIAPVESLVSFLYYSYSGTSDCDTLNIKADDILRKESKNNKKCKISANKDGENPSNLNSSPVVNSSGDDSQSDFSISPDQSQDSQNDRENDDPLLLSDGGANFETNGIPDCLDSDSASSKAHESSQEANEDIMVWSGLINNPEQVQEENGISGSSSVPEEIQDPVSVPMDSVINFSYSANTPSILNKTATSFNSSFNNVAVDPDLFKLLEEVENSLDGNDSSSNSDSHCNLFSTDPCYFTSANAEDSPTVCSVSESLSTEYPSMPKLFPDESDNTNTYSFIASRKTKSSPHPRPRPRPHLRKSELFSINRKRTNQSAYSNKPPLLNSHKSNKLKHNAIIDMKRGRQSAETNEKAASSNFTFLQPVISNVCSLSEVSQCNTSSLVSPDTINEENNSVLLNVVNQIRTPNSPEAKTFSLNTSVAPSEQMYAILPSNGLQNTNQPFQLFSLNNLQGQIQTLEQSNNLSNVPVIHCGSINTPVTENPTSKSGRNVIVPVQLIGDNLKTQHLVLIDTDN